MGRQMCDACHVELNGLDRCWDQNGRANDCDNVFGAGDLLVSSKVYCVDEYHVDSEDEIMSLKVWRV